MRRTLADRVRDANREILENGNAAAIADYFAPAYVLHVADRDRRGLRVVKGFVSELRRSFADLRVEVEILVSHGGRVAWQRTLRGTHEAAFKGFPASGRSIAWRDMVVSRFEDELIAEDWAVSDLAERLLAARH
jgi:steroid delta-isomerase-like uncharacterized protein